MNTEFPALDAFLADAPQFFVTRELVTKCVELNMVTAGRNPQAAVLNAWVPRRALKITTDKIKLNVGKKKIFDALYRALEEEIKVFVSENWQAISSNPVLQKYLENELEESIRTREKLIKGERVEEFAPSDELKNLILAEWKELSEGPPPSTLKSFSQSDMISNLVAYAFTYGTIKICQEVFLQVFNKYLEEEKSFWKRAKTAQGMELENLIKKREFLESLGYSLQEVQRGLICLDRGAPYEQIKEMYEKGEDLFNKLDRIRNALVRYANLP